MLHFAPEPCFEGRLREKLGQGCLTADIVSGKASEQVDIMDIHFPAGMFDVVYCSHVLEHVADDRQALRELYRVLKPSGWAVLLVPIIATRTFEDPSLADPRERERLFGRHDHVRVYGPDFVQRLRDTGFEVRKRGVADLAVDDRVKRKMGLTSASGDIFHCTKHA